MVPVLGRGREGGREGRVGGQKEGFPDPICILLVCVPEYSYGDGITVLELCCGKGRLENRYYPGWGYAGGYQ